MPLFEVAVIQDPTVREREDGELEKLVYGPETIIAASEQAAGMEVYSKAIKVKVTEDKDGLPVDVNWDVKRFRILVRPF